MTSVYIINHVCGATLRRWAMVLTMLIVWGWSAEAQEARPSFEELTQTLSAQNGYYTPRPITDALLLERIALGGTLPNEHTLAKDLPRASLSLLSHKLALPLIANAKAHHPRSYLPSFKEALKSNVWLTDKPKGTPTKLTPLEISQELERSTLAYIEVRHLDKFAMSREQLMRGRESLTQLNGRQNITADFERGIEQGRIQDLSANLRLQEIERRYWVPSFESSIQFSQNYISDNWYKGGASNLNLYMRTYLALQYSRNKVVWLNELEDKLSLYNSDPSKGRRYRVSEDLLRLRSNFGLKASKRWSYTIDAEMRTQLFSTFNDSHTIIRSALFSPITTNVGLGMQYRYSTKSKRVYGRKFSFSANIAPLSYTWRTTARTDIDLVRHGLSTSKPSYHRFGSTIRMDMNWDINMDTSWASRVYLNTSYTATEAEWENTINIRISRYLSTRINLHLRFDDAVKPLAGKGWDKFIQVNEVLSFGFNYKL